jgi:hypothetical protein
MSVEHRRAPCSPVGTTARNAPNPARAARLRGHGHLRAIADGCRGQHLRAVPSARQERRRRCALTCSCYSHARARTAGRHFGAAPPGRRGTNQHGAAGPPRIQTNAGQACHPGSRRDCRSRPRTDGARGEAHSHDLPQHRTAGHDRLPWRACARNRGPLRTASRAVPRRGLPGEARLRASRLGIRMTSRGRRQSAGCRYPDRCRHARRSGLACSPCRRIRVPSHRTRARRVGPRTRGHVPAFRSPDRIPGQIRGRCPIPFAVDPRRPHGPPCAGGGR